MKKNQLFIMIQNERLFTLATIITMTRLLLIPYIAYALCAKNWIGGCSAFMIASTSDAVDGFVARWRNECTLFGALLDALADKLLIITIFASFAFLPASPLIPHWFFYLVFCKEVIQIAGCIIFITAHGYIDMRPLLFGKLTMVVYVMFIVVVFGHHFNNWHSSLIYDGLLIVVSILTGISLLQYFNRTYNQVFNNSMKDIHENK